MNTTVTVQNTVNYLKMSSAFGIGSRITNVLTPECDSAAKTTKRVSLISLILLVLSIIIILIAFVVNWKKEVNTISHATHSAKPSSANTTPSTTNDGGTIAKSVSSTPSVSDTEKTISHLVIAGCSLLGFALLGKIWDYTILSKTIKNCIIGVSGASGGVSTSSINRGAASTLG